MDDYRIEWDGDLWKLTKNGNEFVDCFTHIDEAAAAVVELAARNPKQPATSLRQLFIDADSELSAIAHGRPPSDKTELLRLSGEFRKLYDNRKPNYPT